MSGIFTAFCTGMSVGLLIAYFLVHDASPLSPPPVADRIAGAAGGKEGKG